MSLIYSMIMSLDGYGEDQHGRFGWGAPDEEVHSYINQLASSVGTYLCGPRVIICDSWTPSLLELDLGVLHVTSDQNGRESF